MCTYLLAFAIGEFHCSTADTSRGLPIDIYALPHRSSSIRFALSEAANAVSYFEDFFGIPYPLPRLQMAVIPGFTAGGMENFGLIFFGDSSVLVNDYSTPEQFQTVADTVCHEISHQWFGDLVSPKFWDSLWLNEGFATLFATLAVAEIHPQYHAWERFFTVHVNGALRADSSRLSHPVVTQVCDSGEITTIFDDITYAKGACVLRMLDALLGRAVFRKCCHDYLTEFSWKCVDTSDLCDSFSRSSGIDLRDFFTAWITRPNFPLVILEDDGTVRQERFTFNGPIDDTFWPLSLPIKQANREEFVLKCEAPELVDCSAPWTFLNSGGIAFCRVLQSGRHFKALIEALYTDLTATDRWLILSNYRALARAGLFPHSELLTLMHAFADETEPFVITELCSGLNDLQWLFGGLHHFAHRIQTDFLNRIGRIPVADESDDTRMLRAALLRDLASWSKELKEYLGRLWSEWQADRRSVDSALVPQLFTVAVASDGGFELLLEMYKSHPAPEIQQAALLALGHGSRDELFRVLGMAKEVPIPDIAWLLSGAAMNSLGVRPMWDFVVENWDWIDEIFGMTGFSISTIVLYGTLGMKADSDVASLVELLGKCKSKVTIRAINQVIERIRIDQAVIARDSETVAEFVARMCSL